MTLQQLKTKNPRAAQAYRLVKLAGLSRKAAAARLGLPYMTVVDRVDVATKLLSGRSPYATPVDPKAEAEADARLAAGGRCRCGLLLPCRSCIPTASELAEARAGAGDVWPEGGAW